MHIANTTGTRTGGSKAFYEYPYAVDGANDIWGDATTRPSDIKVAVDESLAKVRGNGITPVGYIYRDQIFSVGNATSGWSKTPEVAPYVAEYAKRGFAGDGRGRMFGYATCNWIKKCSATDLPGSPCQGTLSNVLYKGYCFSSDSGTLECGHLTAIDDEYGQKPIAFGAAATTSQAHTSTQAPGAYPRDNMMPQSAGVTPQSTSAKLVVMPSSPGADVTYRCPTGSPAKGIGTFVSRRLLIAGCMISSDPSYDFMAEVHVPGYCAVPADTRVGCMLPAARNFDPLATQSGKCVFETIGCINANAINFNSEASIQSAQYPCIQARYGCSVNPISYGIKPAIYNGPTIPVAADTPGVKSGYHGSAYRGVGVVPETVYNGPVVLNFNNLANAIGTGDDACVIAVEGCMEPNAANYNPKATVNTWTWCIPKVEGCMMTTDDNANAAYANPSVHQVDGLNGNFSILTTVHVAKYCVVARYGCNSKPREIQGYGEPQLAVNHDSSVTVNTVCYWPISGCMNKDALNYGCQDPDAVSTCTPTITGVDSDQVTSHVKETCKFPWDLKPAPPAPPPPQFPVGLDLQTDNVIVTYTVSLAFTVDGDVSFWSDDVKAKAITTFRAELNLAPELNVTLKVTAGSTVVELIMSSTDESQADAGKASAGSKFTSAASLQNTIGAAVGVKVLSAPRILKTVTIEIRPAPLSGGAIAGIAIGVAAGLFCSCGVLWKSQARTSSQILPFSKDGVYPAQSRVYPA